ncbi:hypothetical protein [Moorena sp. SIO4A1]|uniref:hypothetical protein n=1 Tax=Moorena sp. SIO4A1 TaxID=2607835 RepID=UPI0025E5C857|nr:hypothetical protein [Moorena sp. SIO4A1]
MAFGPRLAIGQAARTRMVTLRSGSVSAKPTLRERKAWPMASASALMRTPHHYPAQIKKHITKQ